MVKSFQEYKLLKEANQNKNGTAGEAGDGPVGAMISLGDGNDFESFEISDDPKSEHYGKNKNLAPIVRAFKGGANWGWSRDDATGNDKPVKISGKKLFLAGGAVRSHLKGEKARNIELACNASPDEVYHILKQNGFEFVNEKGITDVKNKPAHPNRKEGAKQCFWVKKGNKNGRPFAFGVRVNEDEFDLEVFQKNARGYTAKDEDTEPGTHAEDAAGRDFTINSMYIQLDSENGPNKKLHDFHGGIHHLKGGRIVPVGGKDLSQSFKEDPSRILRYVRMMHGYGNPKTLTDEDKNKVKLSADGLSKVDRKYMMGEFKKGMDREGGDCRKLLKLCADLGLLDHLFPGKMLDTDLPKELSELGDKHMPLAWMLRGNDPEALEDLDLDPQDMKKVRFLIKSLGLNDQVDENSLDDLLNGYNGSGISSRKLRDWGTKLGKLNPNIMDAFLSFAKGPRVRLYMNDDEGREYLNDAFSDFQDPFTKELDHRGINERRRKMERKAFENQLSYMRPA